MTVGNYPRKATSIMIHASLPALNLMQQKTFFEINTCRTKEKSCFFY